jgi:hypothetical protein
MRLRRLRQRAEGARAGSALSRGRPHCKRGLQLKQFFLVCTGCQGAVGLGGAREGSSRPAARRAAAPRAFECRFPPQFSNTFSHLKQSSLSVPSEPSDLSLSRSPGVLSSRGSCHPVLSPCAREKDFHRPLSPFEAVEGGCQRRQRLSRRIRPAAASGRARRAADYYDACGAPVPKMASR